MIVFAQFQLKEMRRAYFENQIFTQVVVFIVSDMFVGWGRADGDACVRGCR